MKTHVIRSLEVLVHLILKITREIYKIHIGMTGFCILIGHKYFPLRTMLCCEN